MPLQNRVNPFGTIVAVDARGTMMGNRGGRMHDAAQRLTNERWVSRRWICCLLEFRGRRHPVMGPNSYTALFFLDEATALASGHRPCRECRRAAFDAFKRAWAGANPEHGVTLADSIDAVDRVLHAERTRPADSRRTVELAALPDGAMAAAGEEVWLAWGGAAWRWRWDGYIRAVAPERLALLTPPSIVATLRAGWRPEPHPTLVAAG